MTTINPSTTATRITTRNRVGVVLAALLGLSEIVSTLLIPAPAPGEQGPPEVVLIFGAAMGVLTIAACVYAWVRNSRGGLRVAAASRLLSAITGLPAFFVEGVPAPLVVASAVSLVLTLVAVALLMSRQ
jgi:hypothetical protein